MKSSSGKSIKIEDSGFFEDPKFVEWLNSKDRTSLATWHEQGTVPGEWSDTFVLVDPSLNGEGSDSDMPEHIWNQIVHECRVHFLPAHKPESHIIVWLSN